MTEPQESHLEGDAQGLRRRSGGDPAVEPEDGWARHEAEQRRAWLKLTYAERLAWLEQAKAFARRAQQTRAGRHAGADEPPATPGASRPSRDEG